MSKYGNNKLMYHGIRIETPSTRIIFMYVPGSYIRDENVSNMSVSARIDRLEYTIIYHRYE